MLNTSYFADANVAGQMFFDVPFFEQNFPLERNFLLMMGEGYNIRPALAEKLVFSYLIRFLYTEFYWRLAAGNVLCGCIIVENIFY